MEFGEQAPPAVVPRKYHRRKALQRSQMLDNKRMQGDLRVLPATVKYL
jgi:hypothetical protein